MGRVSDTIGTINTTIRTLLMLVVVGAAGFGGYKAYELYHEPRQTLAGKQAELDAVADELQRARESLAARQQEIDALSAEVAEKTAQVERLEVAMQLLKVTQRLARLRVLDQRERAQESEEEAGDAANGPARPRLVTRIEFVEITPGGDPIGEARQFEILGDMVYLDYLQVTFDDKYVEEAEIDRSTAIALFQRIFGEHQEAAEGFQLDPVGTRPIAYARGKALSEFEQKIWNDFWLIANDRDRAAELGIHAAHGSAVSMRVRPGMSYEIDLRATGPMTIRPVESP